MAAYEYLWVEDMIKENGRTAIFQSVSETPKNPSKPWEGNDRAIGKEVERPAVFIPAYDAHNNIGLSYLSPDLLVRAEELVICSGLEELRDTHIIKDAGVVWKVQWLNVLQPGKTTALFTFGVKR